MLGKQSINFSRKTLRFFKATEAKQNTSMQVLEKESCLTSKDEL